MKNKILGTLNPTVGFEKQQIGRMNLTFAIDKKDSPEHEIQLLDIQISNFSYQFLKLFQHLKLALFYNVLWLC